MSENSGISSEAITPSSGQRQRGDGIGWHHGSLRRWYGIGGDHAGARTRSALVAMVAGGTEVLSAGRSSTGTTATPSRRSTRSARLGRRWPLRTDDLRRWLRRGLHPLHLPGRGRLDPRGTGLRCSSGFSLGPLTVPPTASCDRPMMRGVAAASTAVLSSMEPPAPPRAARAASEAGSSTTWAPMLSLARAAFCSGVSRRPACLAVRRRGVPCPAPWCRRRAPRPGLPAPVRVPWRVCRRRRDCGWPCHAFLVLRVAAAGSAMVTPADGGAAVDPTALVAVTMQDADLPMSAATTV